MVSYVYDVLNKWVWLRCGELVKRPAKKAVGRVRTGRSRKAKLMRTKAPFWGNQDADFKCFIRTFAVSDSFYAGYRYDGLNKGIRVS